MHSTTAETPCVLLLAGWNRDGAAVLGRFGENGLRPAAGVSVFCCVNQANCNEEVIMKTFMGFRSVASWLPFSNKAASMALMGHCPERLGLPAREAAQIAAVLNARSIA
jgi:hypothetical protein